MSQPHPRIAVLIPAYNAEKTLPHTLDSLRANGELHDIFVVDDGSRTSLAEILPPQDNLKILRPAHNGGIVKALNLGLEAILAGPYDYLARLDADDRAAPDRLAQQRAFLDTHPDVGLVGSAGRFVSEGGETVFFLNPPQDHATLVRKLFYNNCFLHPSLMIRTALLREAGPYSEAFPGAEDYEIIRRLAARAKVANLPGYLIDYTLSPGGLSLSKRREQVFSRLKVQWLYRDFRSSDFYFGLCKTLILSLLPYGLITAIKKTKKDYQPQ